jgi:predicted GIY-YIG superfamily endonuclease
MDFSKRLHLHNKNAVNSTAEAGPWSEFKVEEFPTREQARYFEWQLKKSRGKRQKWLSK